MSAQSFECQIAKGQIGRYLSGDPFSSEALRQLEEHIASCEGCKAHLNERKAALQAMLGSSRNPAQPELAPSTAIQKPEPEAVANPLVEAYLKALQTAEPKAQPKKGWKGFSFKMNPKTAPVPAAAAPKTSFAKTFGYSAALAVVLGAMSIGSRYMDRITGSRVLAAGETISTPSKTIPAPEPANLTPVRKAAQPLKKPIVSAPVPHHKETLPARSRTATPPLDIPSPQEIKKAAALKPLKPLVARPKKPVEKPVDRAEEVVPTPRHRHHPTLVVHKVKPAARARAHARKAVVKRAHPKPHVVRKHRTSQGIRVYDAEGNQVR